MLCAVRADPYSEPPSPYRPGWDEPRPPRRGPGRWKIPLLLGLVVAVGLGALTVAATMSRSADVPADGTWVGATDAGSASAGGAAAGTSAPATDATLSLAATGDIVMGNAPSGLPPNGGRDFFAKVSSVLGADLQMGNLEQTLTEDTGTAKCSAASAGKTCFAFRTPPSYATVLRDAGFGLVTMANNHAYDYGRQGYQNTKNALDEAGVAYTGDPDLVTVVPVKGVRVAVVGFAPYSWANDPNDLEGARAVVTKAASQADIVVVQVHMGAEGSDKTHVKPGTETYLGENRGDPIKFSHTVVDAGADLVIGHGPHVMRGMEFYKERLIAYSLGNFGGYRALSSAGLVGVGGVVKVTLRGDGAFVEGTLASTVMVSPGLPKVDPKNQAVKLVASLSTADFGETGAQIDGTGRITPPA
ncbi:MAG: CapA family protein [Dactylosporangium sp.]|nr:CapA family protein [Dactylosporangium sp.]NNJ63246.1 CapA family protein [Dactylosporangium sp.]